MHFKLYVFVLLVFINVFISLRLEAQIPEPVFKHFTVEDGLPSSQVYQAMQDVDGYMWFVTDRGLVKYNGYEFKTFTTKDGLADNVVFKLFQDNKKRIWMITFSGRIFIYENNKITAYKYNSRIQDIVKGGGESKIYVDSSDNVFVAGRSGEFMVDSRGIMTPKFRIIIDPEINKFLVDERNYFKGSGAFGNISTKQRPTDFFHVTNSGIDSIRLPINVLGRISDVRLKNNELLFSIGNILYELKDKSIIQLTKFPEDVINLFEDKQQSLWVCTVKGLYFFNQPGMYSKYSYFFADERISYLAEDREGGFWITTINDGVYYLMNQAVKNFKSDPKLQAPLVLTSDKSNIYAGYFSGSLAKMNANGLTLILNDSSGHYIDCLFYDTLADRLYIGNDSLRYLYHANSFLVGGNGAKSSRIGFVKSKHELYTGAYTVLVKIAGDSSERETEFNTRLNCIYLNEKDELFFGCLDGVYKYEYHTKTISLISSQLKDVRVDDIESLNGNLCFATQGNGLMIQMKDSSFKKIDESDGLCNNIIRKIKVNGNKIWCASYSGISEINFTDFKNFKFSITNVSTNEGLISNEINDLTVLNDTVWIASKNGISFYNVNTDFVNHVPPLVHFISFQVNNVDTLVRDNYQFSHTLNNISIGFESPLYKSDGKQTYHYLLTVSNDTIRGTTTNRSVQFLSLEPGNYSLFVKAMNNSRIWSGQPATLHFTILVPWYNTWWFRLMCLIFLGTSGFIFYKRRVNKMEEKFNNERKQASLQLTAMRAQMNPHFIFNVMSSIRNYMQNNDMLSAEKYLTSFAKLVRYTLDNSAVQEGSLEEELEAIRSYATLEMQRVELGFDFEIECDDGIDVDEIMLPSLLLQPFVENAIKHGIDRLNSRGKIRIEIKKNGEKVLIAIEDNGVGRDDAAEWNQANRGKHTSHGSKLTFDRIEAFNKAYNTNIKVRVTDLRNIHDNSTGTRVEIAL